MGKRRLLLAYRIKDRNSKTSHAGVGQTALHIAKTLRKKGELVDVIGVDSAKHLEELLQGALDRVAKGYPETPFSHVVISAMWMPTQGLAHLCERFPYVEFVIHSHSNVGFLQADDAGVRLLREAVDLQFGLQNLKISGNTQKYRDSLAEVFAVPALCLPNCYFLDRAKPPRPIFSSGTLQVGIFGANRPQKNQLTAAWAAIQIARQLNKKLECYTNIPPGPTANGLIRAIRQTFQNQPDCELIEKGWMDWPYFRRLVSSMDLLLAPSYTETFCNVVGDAVAEGVPAVVGDATEWAPDYWKADTDNASEIAHVGRALLSDPRAVFEGLKKLEEQNALAVHEWLQFLDDGVN